MNPNGGGYHMGNKVKSFKRVHPTSKTTDLPTWAMGYPQQNYPGYGPMYQPGQQRDSQQRVIQARRVQDNEAMSRFNGAPLSNFRGGILELCKDQPG
ncbi:hypothetical protein LQW54_012454 [Pestalotiopsis sp. IQ-011]